MKIQKIIKRRVFCWQAFLKWTCWIFRRWLFQRWNLQLRELYPKVVRQRIRIWIDRWYIWVRQWWVLLFLVNHTSWNWLLFLIRWMGFPKIKITNYDSSSQSFQELFEVQSITWCFAHFVQDSENNIEFGIKTQSLGSQENISDINSSLSWISIEWEQSVKFSNGVWGEDGIFSSNILWEDSLKIFGLDLFSGHEISL